MQYIFIKLTFCFELGLIRCKVLLSFMLLWGEKCQLIDLKIKTLTVAEVTGEPTISDGSVYI